MTSEQLREIAGLLAPFMTAIAALLGALEYCWPEDGASRRRLARNRRAAMRRSRLYYTILAPLLYEVPRPRRWWVRERMRRAWWSEEVLQKWDDYQWLYHFRMTKATLFEIAGRLRPYLERRTTGMRQAISVEERVAITVWWLTSPLIYRKTANTFGLGVSTVSVIVIEVCLAIEHELLASTVCLGDYRRIMDGFRQMGFPQCVGAVDGTHIKVRPPKGRGEEFVNRKSAFSILLQGTVDHSGRFVDIVLGYTGRTHDAFVFRHSSLWHAMEAGKFVPGNPTITIGGVTIGPVILGDAAYPLSRWLMKPYGGHLTPKKIAYNRVFNHCRNVVERAFGRLKARWGCLSAPLTVSEKNYLPVVSACVVLHNICESKGHLLHPVIQKPSPLTLRRTDRESRPQDSSRRIHEGELVRDAIANMIAGDCN